MVTSYDDRNSLSIIILNNQEEVLEWLDPDKCELIETSKVEACRKIKLSYPMKETDINNEYHWYNQGNKIYIPATSGINSCLYIINTEYSIDYWDKNYITVEAEEILTELNYNFVAFLTEVTTDKEKEDSTTTTNNDDTSTQIKSGEMVEQTVETEVITGTQVFKYKDTIKLTSEVLTKLFGYYYDIAGMDQLTEKKDVITPTGSMSYMSLLRLIEEQTDRIFITDYVSVENKILRRLSLKNVNNIRRVAMTETLDLNYNLDSLELSVSEENTFNAMAPEFTEMSTVVTTDVANEGTSEVSSSLVNKASNGVGIIQTNYSLIYGDDNTTTEETTNTTTNTKTTNEVIQDWLDYEVEVRQEIPMIAQRDESGNLITVATWYAPFEKLKGNLEITSDRQTQGYYNDILTYNGNVEKRKCGKVSTSETIPALIYNTLANSLLNKLNPEYELNVSVKDIQQLLGITNLGYNVFETLQVRIPNFDYYVPCRITETTKNLHKPGENTIKVETDVKSMRNIKPTDITSNDMIINNSNKANVSGILTSEEIGLPEKTVTINIRLKTPFSATTTINNLTTQQVVSTFKPEEETYVFYYDELAKLELILKNIEVTKSTKNSVNLRASNGIVYKVSISDANTIYNTFIACYMMNEIISEEFSWTVQKLKNAKWDTSYSIHIYPREETMRNAKLGVKKYFYSYFHYLVEDAKTMDKQGGSNIRNLIFAADWQGHNPTCVPASLSSISSQQYRYIPEYQWYQFVSNTDGGVNISSFKLKLSNAKTALEKNNKSFHIFTTPFIEEFITVDYQLPINFKSDFEGNKNIHQWTTLLFVDISKLGAEYYDGVYSGKTGGHGIYMISWKKVDGVLWCYVLDPNMPIFNPISANIMDVEDGWVKYSVLSKAVNIVYDDNLDSLKNRSNVSQTPYCLVLFDYYDGCYVNGVVESTASEIKLDVKNIDISNNIYKFTKINIQDAINKIYSSWIGGDKKLKLETINLSVPDSVNQLYSLSMKTLRALAYNFMLYYMGQNKESTNLTIELSPTSNATKYLNHMGTDMDYNTPVYPQWIKYEPNFILASVCFELGYLFSFRDFFQNNTSNITFSDMITEITSKTKLTVMVREANETKIKSAIKTQSQSSFKETVAVVYAKSDTLTKSAIYQNTIYPILLYDITGTNISYYNLAGRGNSPVYNYDTKKTDAGDLNPHGTIPISTLITWINNAKTEAEDGGNMLIVSRTLKLGSL